MPTNPYSMFPLRTWVEWVIGDFRFRGRLIEPDETPYDGARVECVTQLAGESMALGGHPIRLGPHVKLKRSLCQDEPAKPIKFKEVEINLEPPVDDLTMQGEIERLRIHIERYPQDVDAIVRSRHAWLIELWTFRQCAALETPWDLPGGFVKSDGVVDFPEVVVAARLSGSVRDEFLARGHTTEEALGHLRDACSEDHGPDETDDAAVLPDGHLRTPWGQAIGRTERPLGASSPFDSRCYPKPAKPTACTHPRHTELLWTTVCADCGEPIT